MLLLGTVYAFSIILAVFLIGLAVGGAAASWLIRRTPADVALGLCQLLLTIGIAFLSCGIQTVTGKAKDTMGNAIGSILLGGVLLLAGLAIAVFGVMGNKAGGPGPGMPKEVMFIAGIIAGFLGLFLVIAGIMALAGRSGYREWRQYHFPSRRRRRRDRYDD